MSIRTINCATGAMAQSGMPEARIAAHLRLCNPQEEDAKRQIWYHQFDLQPAEREIAQRLLPKYGQHMWGVHATTRLGLAHILRDGLKAVPVEHNGAGVGFVTVRGMEVWTEDHPEKLDWIEKSRISTYNSCNVLVEVAWVGMLSKDPDAVRCYYSPERPGVFYHRVKNSAYFVHPADIAITGLYYVNQDLPAARNVPEWE